MSDFIRSNGRLDKAVLDAESFEDMRERMKAELAAQGTIARSREDGNYGARLIGQPVPDAPREVPLPTGYGAERILYLGNTRIIITGATEADLDTQEAAIRGQR